MLKEPKKANDHKWKYFFDLEFTHSRQYFFENLVLMMSSGIDIIEILDGLRLEVRSKNVQQMITEIKQEIQSGYPLWMVLDEHKVLPQSLLTIVRIGEESGSLVRNLQVVVKQQEKDKEFRAKLQSASLYPALIVILMTVVGIGVIFFVLPSLAGVYGSFETDLPWSTRALIAIGNFFKGDGIVLLPIFVLALLIVNFILFLFPKTKVLGQKLSFRLPVIKRMIQELELSRMGFLLGTLLENGFPVVDAIMLLHDSSSFYAYRKFYSFLGAAIESGQSFAQSFASYKDIPRLLPLQARQVIISAEKSGSLAVAFQKVGDIFEKRSEYTTKNFSILIEPILLLLVWVGVAFLALAVILPIYGLIDSVRDVGSSSYSSSTSIN